MSFIVSERAALLLESVLSRYQADAVFIHTMKSAEGYRCIAYPGIPRSTHEHEVVITSGIVFLFEKRVGIRESGTWVLPFDLLIDVCEPSGEMLEIVASGPHPWGRPPFRTVSKEAFRV